MRVLILLISLSLSLPIYADSYLNGNGLQTNCREYSKFKDGRNFDTMKYGSCTAYITAVSDSHDVFVEWGKMSPMFCSPNEVTNGQLAAVVVKYLEANPEELHYAAADIVTNALAQAFPCN